MCYEMQHLTRVFPADLMRGIETQDTNRVFYPTTGKYNIGCEIIFGGLINYTSIYKIVTLKLRHLNTQIFKQFNVFFFQLNEITI